MDHVAPNYVSTWKGLCLFPNSRKHLPSGQRHSGALAALGGIWKRCVVRGVPHPWFLSHRVPVPPPSLMLRSFRLFNNLQICGGIAMKTPGLCMGPVFIVFPAASSFLWSTIFLCRLLPWQSRTGRLHVLPVHAPPLSTLGLAPCSVTNGGGRTKPDCTLVTSGWHWGLVENTPEAHFCSFFHCCFGCAQ